MSEHKFALLAEWEPCGHCHRFIQPFERDGDQCVWCHNEESIQEDDADRERRLADRLQRVSEHYGP